MSDSGTTKDQGCPAKKGECPATAKPSCADRIAAAAEMREFPEAALPCGTKEPSCGTTVEKACPDKAPPTDCCGAAAKAAIARCEAAGEAKACSVKPECEAPKPACEAPKPACEAPKPACEDPKPACEDPKPACEAPKPACEAPKPACEAPKPACEAPKPACEAPKPACEAPKPACEDPKPACEVSTPEPLAEKDADCEAPKPTVNANTGSGACGAPGASNDNSCEVEPLFFTREDGTSGCGPKC